MQSFVFAFGVMVNITSIFYFGLRRVVVRNFMQHLLFAILSASLAARYLTRMVACQRGLLKREGNKHTIGAAFHPV